MIPGFEAIVEQRIQKARKEGAFDNLPGTGKPLPLEDMDLPKELRLGYKILKNAGFLPPEIELKKKITQVEQLLEQTDIDSENGKALTKKLNFLFTKLNTLRGTDAASSLVCGPYGRRLKKKLS